MSTKGIGPVPVKGLDARRVGQSLRRSWEVLPGDSCSVQPSAFCSVEPSSRIQIQARYGTVEEALYAARQYAKDDDAQQAFTTYTLALDLDEDSSSVCDEFGQFLLSHGQLDGAEMLFSRAIFLDPLNAEYFYRRGVVLQQKRQSNEAIEDFCSALQIDPLFTGALFSRGAVHHALGQYVLASADFKRILEVEEENHCALALLSESLYAMGDLDGAVRCLKQALRLDPTNRSIQKDLDRMQRLH